MVRGCAYVGGCLKYGTQLTLQMNPFTTGKMAKKYENRDYCFAPSHFTVHRGKIYSGITFAESQSDLLKLERKQKGNKCLIQKSNNVRHGQQHPSGLMRSFNRVGRLVVKIGSRKLASKSSPTTMGRGRIAATLCIKKKIWL